METEVMSHKKLNEMIQTTMHRGSEFEREELLKSVAEELARLPLDHYEFFMTHLFENLKNETVRIKEFERVSEDVFSDDTQAVGSEFVDDKMFVK